MTAGVQSVCVGGGGGAVLRARGSELRCDCQRRQLWSPALGIPFVNMTTPFYLSARFLAELPIALNTMSLDGVSF